MAARPPDVEDERGRLKAIQEDLVSLLQQLDDLELHYAAAHVSTALDSLKRDRPAIAPFPGRAG